MTSAKRDVCSILAQEPTRASVSLLVEAVLVIWLILLVVVQFRRWHGTVKRWDTLDLAPSWSVFAPVPIQAEYLLECRTWDSHGERSRWSEVLSPTPRRLSDAVVNRRRYTHQALWEYGDALVWGGREHWDDLVSDPSYRALMNVVIAWLPLSNTPVALQFRLRCVQAGATSQPVEVARFCSAVHGLPWRARDIDNRP